MHVAMIVLSLVLALIVLGSGVGKLRKAPQVLEAMRHVGVKDSQIPVLALLEIAGGLGLLIGFWYKTLGIISAICLAAYFVGAVVSRAGVGGAAGGGCLIGADWMRARRRTSRGHGHPTPGGDRRREKGAGAGGVVLPAAARRDRRCRRSKAGEQFEEDEGRCAKGFVWEVWPVSSSPRTGAWRSW
jgi:uncharacterized membrane protein YphA (DoxX/SURF4 family)